MALSKEDLKAIQNLMRFVIEREIEPLKKQISNLPTKDEYFNRMDSLLKEVKEYRMERVTLGSQMDRLKQRVDKIEVKVGIQNE